jgi:hypothetical protein
MGKPCCKAYVQPQAECLWGAASAKPEPLCRMDCAILYSLVCMCVCVCVCVSVWRWYYRSEPPRHTSCGQLRSRQPHALLVQGAGHKAPRVGPRGWKQLHGAAWNRHSQGSVQEQASEVAQFYSKLRMSHRRSAKLGIRSQALGDLHVHRACFP